MSSSVRILIGIFIILHGLVHPIMAAVPQPMAEQSNNNPPTFGGFWTESWLLGEGQLVKGLIYGLAVLTAITLLAGGLGFMGPQTWSKTVWLAGAGLSLFLLVMFWNPYFVLGIVIDGFMIVAPFATSWFTY